MQNNTNPQKPMETRRTFLQSTSAFVAGLCLTRRSTAQESKPVKASKETLALAGGPKAVTHPHADADRWPRYGPKEEEAIVKLIWAPS